MILLRSLRAHSTSSAETELRQDGTAHVKFSKNQTVGGGANGEVDLPPEVTIAIPVIKGHGDIFKLVLKLRASVGSDAKLELRFTMPAAQTVLEQVYGELVDQARSALGSDFTIHRAAD